MGWEDGGATAQSFKNAYVAKTFSISPPSMVRSYSESVYETKECICLWDTDLPILYGSDCFSFSTCSLRDVYAQPYLRCGVRYAIPFRRHGDHGAISDTLSLIMTQTFWSVCNILPLRNQLRELSALRSRLCQSYVWQLLFLGVRFRCLRSAVPI